MWSSDGTRLFSALRLDVKQLVGLMGMNVYDPRGVFAFPSPRTLPGCRRPISVHSGTCVSQGFPWIRLRKPVSVGPWIHVLAVQTSAILKDNFPGYV